MCKASDQIYTSFFKSKYLNGIVEDNETIYGKIRAEIIYWDITGH